MYIECSKKWNNSKLKNNDEGEVGNEIMMGLLYIYTKKTAATPIIIMIIISWDLIHCVIVNQKKCYVHIRTYKVIDRGH